jgi:hypothetical protein
VIEVDPRQLCSRFNVGERRLRSWPRHRWYDGFAWTACPRVNSVRRRRTSAWPSLSWTPQCGRYAYAMTVTRCLNGASAMWSARPADAAYTPRRAVRIKRSAMGHPWWRTTARRGLRASDRPDFLISNNIPTLAGIPCEVTTSMDCEWCSSVAVGHERSGTKSHCHDASADPVMPDPIAVAAWT